MGQLPCNGCGKHGRDRCICGPGKFAPVKRKHDSIENEKTKEPPKPINPHAKLLKANEGEGDGKSNVSEPPLTRDQRLHMQLQIEKLRFERAVRLQKVAEDIKSETDRRAGFKAAEARDKKASHQTNVPWSKWKHSHKWWHKAHPWERDSLCNDGMQ